MSKFDQSHHFTPCELDARQRRDWSDTRFALTVVCPGFSSIFYEMLNNSGGDYIALFTRDVDTLATDSVNIMINPDFFFGFGLKERLFMLAHEILHPVFNHIIQGYQLAKTGYIQYPDGAKLAYTPRLGNIAMDYCINAVLVNAAIGELPVMKEGSPYYDTNIATHQSKWPDVYRKLYQENKRGGGGVSFDKHLEPGVSKGQDPAQAAAEHNQAKWDNAIANAAAIEAKKMGSEESLLARMFNAMLTPKVSWDDKIVGLLARKTGSGGYNFRRMDRRMIVRDIYIPERSGHGTDTVICAFDISGSMLSWIGENFAELYGIISDTRPREVIVLWCDMHIQRVDYVNDVGDLDELMKFKPRSGGTDFRPVFKWIDDQDINPDALVYLTDGEGRFPSHAPEYPVIWGSTIKHQNYPFGDVVDLTGLK